MKCKYVTVLSPFDPSHLPSLNSLSCPTPQVDIPLFFDFYVESQSYQNVTLFFDSSLLLYQSFGWMSAIPENEGKE